ncbi:hypothetical protein HNY73_022651 [Argiope bruennichi]|uniref:Uncharacterized protein n=1 Tax=Argiope bruennichi TaxID=94029 RepID=A0A8T0E2V3_ARGBR|nr:hypothetical protein HNY73_022651 [Argiope bruennichi]
MIPVGALMGQHIPHPMMGAGCFSDRDPPGSVKLEYKWQEAANTSIIPCQQEPKKLTTEALCFLCVILVFVLLCLIGSSIRAYESFRKVFTKKEILQNLKEQRNERNRVTQVTTKKKEDEHLTISDWKGKCRKFFNCFSIQTNARQILSTDTDQEHMDCVDGIRILYFLCVFLAHFFLFAARALNIDIKMNNKADTCRAAAWDLSYLSAHFGWCGILLFVIPSLIGSAINAFESFCGASPKKKSSTNGKDQRNDANGETNSTTEKEEDESSTISVWSGSSRKFFDCFCVQTNARKILSTSSNHGYLDCIDGIRAIIFLWIFMHIFSSFMFDQ